LPQSKYLKPFPISDFFKLLLLTGRVLSRLKTALIVPVPKKGNLCQIQNYRPISLTEPLRKLLEHCLLKFINTKISPSFLTQGGFRTNHCCNDMIIVLQETALKYKSNLHTAFLDIRAASLLKDKFYGDAAAIEAYLLRRSGPRTSLINLSRHSI
jgi:hypothetical protein